MGIDKLRKMIAESNNIVFFGGAGTSTESSIPDFRSSTGLYKKKQGRNYSPEEILSRKFFMNNVEEFYQFYKEKMIYKDAKPNLAHYALADLEKRGKLKAVITQNIDGLHQLAGSKKVLEIHGSIYHNYCLNCDCNYDLGYVLDSKEIVPKCIKCGGIVRPDVVLYGEILDEAILWEAISYIQKADILIVGGTSLVVNPAAGLINYYNGNKLVLINKGFTPYDGRADLVINDSIGKVLNSVL